jgi:methyltransferase (TIGR00027 family)
MNDAEPSTTALRVAERRAAHQLFDDPKVLVDPVAVRILAPSDAERLAQSGWRERSPMSIGLRAWMVARSRFAEDELARARDRGTRQYVILGAGLDTFAYRQPADERPLTVFEVDHPATQQWKRRRLADARVPVPTSVRFVATDFESGGLAEELDGAGFDWRAPAFFAWLGVTMYLTDEAIGSTLAFLASTAPGGGVVFDYFLRTSSANPLERVARAAIAHRVAHAGEPFRTSFEPAELTARVRNLGFRAILDLGPTEINARYFAGRADRLRVSRYSGRILSAER